MGASVNPAKKRPLGAKHSVPVSQAVAKSLPHWDVDLQSVEYIGQLSLTVTPGDTLRDVTIKVSTKPFGVGARVICSRRISGAFSNSLIAEIGTAGRYIRIEAAHLALEEVDVLLPDPSPALPERVLNDALTLSDGGWNVAADTAQSAAQPSQDAQTFDVSHPAGGRYRVEFDLCSRAVGDRLFAWWNGALIEARGFVASDTVRRCTFDVVTTGAVDKLTFRGMSAGASAENVLIEPVPQRVTAKPSAATVPSGRIQGVLRRSIPDPTHGLAAARKAMALLGFADNDEIIFR